MSLMTGACFMLVALLTGNSTDTLEFAGDTIEYEVPQPHMMSMQQ